jgi:sarcosine oxidase
VTIRTRSGSVEAERVLVAAGGQTQSLLGQSLGFTVYARTAALFRLSAAEVQRLAGMPSMRCFGPKGENPYILPPIPYPDGHTWLKLGGDPVDLPLESEADIKDGSNRADRFRLLMGFRSRSLTVFATSTSKNAASCLA